MKMNNYNATKGMVSITVKEYLQLIYLKTHHPLPYNSELLELAENYGFNKRYIEDN
jgi:hypothetical protein